VLLVVGSVFPEFDPRTLEVGWRTMKGALEGGRQTTLFAEPLTIGVVHRTMERIAKASGSGSRRVKTGLLEGLVSRAGPAEVEVLVRIVFGEMRIGVNEGMMLEGIAEAAGVATGLVRRALMLTGDLGEVARTALEAGEGGLKAVKMRMFVPLKPMLASMSYDRRGSRGRHRLRVQVRRGPDPDPPEGRGGEGVQPPPLGCHGEPPGRNRARPEAGVFGGHCP